VANGEAVPENHPLTHLLDLVAMRWQGLGEAARLDAMRDLFASLERVAPPLRRRLHERLRDLGLDSPASRPARTAQAVRLEHALASGSRTDMAGLVADLSLALPRSSLIMLVELAASDRLLREALCLRPDLGDDIAARLWPYLGTPQQLRLLDAGRALLPREMDQIDSLAATDELHDGADDLADLARRFDVAGTGRALARLFDAPAFDCLALVANRYVRGPALVLAALDLPPDRTLPTLEALLWLRGRIVGVVDRRRNVADLRLARRFVSDAQSGLAAGRREAFALIAALRERAGRAATPSAEGETRELETSRAA
jgi:hypothetical protein